MDCTVVQLYNELGSTYDGIVHIWSLYIISNCHIFDRCFGDWSRFLVQAIPERVKLLYKVAFTNT